MYTAAGNARENGKENFLSAYDVIAWSQTKSDAEKNILQQAANGIGTTDVTPSGFIDIASSVTFMNYADMMPPVDVVLTFGNEYGQSAFQKIYDLEILNEAGGVSIDTNVLEKHYTWIARNISPLFQGKFNMTK